MNLMDSGQEVVHPEVCCGCNIHARGSPLPEPAGSLWTERNPERLVGMQLRTSPHKLKFCQDSILRFFRDGTSVFDLRRGTPKIVACFHSQDGDTRLFALNNRTLFNAIYNDISAVLVNIIEKPAEWPTRFTGRRPWMCTKVRGLRSGSHARELQDDFSDALIIPSAVFPGQQRRSVCFVVAEVCGLVKPNPNGDTFYRLLSHMSPDLDIRPYEEDARSFVRVWVNEDDVPLVRNMARAIAESGGMNVRNVRCREVPGLRRYESPRD